MSDIAKYTFLPWLRQGLANKISDTSGNRATFELDVTLTGQKIDGSGSITESISKTIQLYGPGDIIGIDPRAIVKVEPRNWITNFEPNYMPYIEFYDEDFPWRYSPLQNTEKLKPWLALVVLKESEFTDGKNIKDRPLPYILLNDTAILPNLDQAHAWAHVHVNEDIIASGNETTVVSNDATNLNHEIENVINRNPDLAYSRIICARRLKENEAYHAFLVPVFKAGYLAALGQQVEPNSNNAWDEDTALGDFQLPYYHRWYFRTGTVGDFEYLVRLLEPKPADKRIGYRDVDMQNPGGNLSGMNNDDDSYLQGYLKLGGALKVPDASFDTEELNNLNNYRNWSDQPDYPKIFQIEIAKLINLQNDYETEETIIAHDKISNENIYENPDPVIVPPLYGRWHSKTERLLFEKDTDGNPLNDEIPNNRNWVHDINLDPQWRMPAGIGTNVIQDNQENYMQASWQQIGEVLEANKRIKLAQLANETSAILHFGHLNLLRELSNQRYLMVTTPFTKRVINQGVIINAYDGDGNALNAEDNKLKEIQSSKKTAYAFIKESTLSVATISVNFKKMIRPRGNVICRLQLDNKIEFNKSLNALISKDNIDRNEVKILKETYLNNKTKHIDKLVSRLNDRTIVVAPTLAIPKGINSIDKIIQQSKPTGLPAPILQALEKYPLLKWLPLIMMLVILGLVIVFPGTLAYVLAIPGLGGLYYLHQKLDLWTSQIENSNAMIGSGQTQEAIDKMPFSPDFRITSSDENFIPKLNKNGVDSEEAKRFKIALKEYNKVMELREKIKAQEKPSLELDLSKINETVFTKSNPRVTIPKWVRAGLSMPDWIVNGMYHPIKDIEVEQYDPLETIMAYPRIDLPMYKPLADKSAELFLPNINYVEQNSITILEANQKFIESYMVGLNHEFSRELLWREYPTDQRGTYFRQFWDVTGYLDTKPTDESGVIGRFKERLLIPGNKDSQPTFELQEMYNRLLNPDVVKTEELLNEAKALIVEEELRDIKPIHVWQRRSDLGDHDNRGKPGEKKNEVVLVIRGELLKKYPTAVIYAHKAEWEYKEVNGDKVIDLSKPRKFATIDEDLNSESLTATIKLPLYEAKVEPDIYFFGFDITVCQARGGSGERKEGSPEFISCGEGEQIKWNDAGWFFVIKERPGEPRFGFDIDNDNASNVIGNKIKLWNDLAWTDLQPTVANEAYLNINTITGNITATANPATENEGFTQQQNEDKQIEWSADMNSAELAYILYQVPVMVGVHAAEMVTKPKSQTI